MSESEIPEESLPMNSIRRETGLIELTCVHGIGHPAYASADWMDKTGPEESAGTWLVHGCDGCCSSPEWQIHDLSRGVEIANDMILSQHQIIQEAFERIALFEAGTVRIDEALIEVEGRPVWTIDSPEESVRQWLETQTFGSVRVHEASVDLDETSDGQPLVRFTVTLDDPTEGAETWPLEDISSMLRGVDERAAESGIATRWSTSFHQTSAEDFASDDLPDSRNGRTGDSAASHPAAASQ
jgi:hypothetical protein